MDIENGLWWLGICLACWGFLSAHDSRCVWLRVPARVFSLVACLAVPCVVLVWFVWIFVLCGNLR